MVIWSDGNRDATRVRHDGGVPHQTVKEGEPGNGHVCQLLSLKDRQILISGRSEVGAREGGRRCFTARDSAALVAFGERR